MLRLSLTNLIASRNPKEGDYLDDNESEICIQEKQIIWPEGDCGGETQRGKTAISYHSKHCPDKERKYLFSITLKSRARMNDWKLRASKTFEINVGMVFLRKNKQNLLLELFK